MKNLRKFERYVVVSNRFEHGYSCKLGDKIALNYALDAAKHRSTRGNVYGVYADGEKVLVFEWKDNS